MIRALVPVIASATLLSGCVIYANEGGSRDVVVSAAGVDAPSEPLEAVRAVRIADGRLVVRVDSNGCTDVGSFEAVVRGGAQQTVALKRIRPDLCRAFLAEGAEVSWALSDLGLEPGEAIVLENPLKP